MQKSQRNISGKTSSKRQPSWNDTINVAKRRGQILSEQEVTASVCPQIDWNVEELQRGENGENRVLTEEEMELINEFLQV